MYFQKIPAFFFAILAVRSALAADPVASDEVKPPPAFLTAPAKLPPPDADRPLPLGDSVPRPTTPPSLLPDEIPTPAKRAPLTKQPAPGKPSTMLKPQATAAEFDLRLRYRKARNVAESNENVRAAWEISRDAKTDQGKRQALKRYYEVLFARMLTLDRGIAPLVEDRRKAETAALSQTHIAPTVPSEL